MKWEYDVVTIFDPEGKSQYLNRRGAEGWELVHYEWLEWGGGFWHMIFKRVVGV